MRPAAAFVAVMLTLAAQGASAKPIDKQYKTAVKLENSGDIAGALSAFEAIAPEQRDYNTKLHIASCTRKLGRMLDAEKLYEAIRTDPKADTATVETAASDLEDLRSRIPKMRIRLTPATTAVVVTVDGVEIKPPIEHRANPGEHEVIAKRGELTVYERRINLPESAAVDVEIDAPAAPPPKTTAPPATTTMLETPAANGLSRALPFYVGGGVLVAGSIVSFVLASSAKSGVADSCAAQHSLTCNLDDAGGSRVRTWETIGWVSGGLAIAAIGVGVVLHSRGDQHAAPSAALVVRPTLGRATGFSIEGQF